MKYQSETIATVLKRLNVNYLLPAIQREYVWQPEQIIQLFDSIMRNYPIGSFLFWEVDEQNRYKWDVYQFVQNYKQDDTHNEPVRTDGIQQLTLVLDGQQRLTSLLIGLKGTYTLKKKYLRWDHPNAWVKQELYLDLLKDPKTGEDDAEEGLRYAFRFMEKAPRSDSQSHWFKVGRILDCDSDEQFYTLLDQEEEQLSENVSKLQMKIFNQNLSRLYRAIWKDDFIAYYTEHDQNYDRVLTIFVRANQGGTKLTKSDLLLSMVTARWENVSARDEIYAFVDRLNNDLTHKNNFDKDFIMKTCLVLSDLPVQYKVENFSNSNLMEIHARWKDIKNAIERGVTLVNTFGLDRDTLTSANALIPIIYYLYRHPGLTLLGSTAFEVENARRVHQWLLMVLLNNSFSGQSDSALTSTRKAVADHVHENAFPADAINAALRKSGRKASFDDTTIDTILGLAYGKSLTFLALSLLYDDNRWGNVSYHQDHIFPRAYFTQAHMKSIGLDVNEQKRYQELCNRLGNLQLLVSHENLGKSDTNVEHWLATRDAGFKKRHLIPDDANLLRFEQFAAFIQAREDLIRQRLKGILFSSDEQQATQPRDIHPERQVFIHELLYQFVDERDELERDECDAEVVRFGVKAWDTPVLKANASGEWPSSGRLLLFSWVNREQKLYLQLGLCQSATRSETRTKLFEMALTHQPPFHPAHYQQLPQKWIYLYQRTFLDKQAYTSFSDEEVTTSVYQAWSDFMEKDLPQLTSVLKAQPWLW